MARAFLDTLGHGSGREWVMARLWRDLRLLRVERRAPVATAAGKIHHVVRSMGVGPRTESLAQV